MAVTFNNTPAVLDALQQGVALVDRSHWGRLRVAGGDRLALLHNQSTAAFSALAPGQGCDTVRACACWCCLLQPPLRLSSQPLAAVQQPARRWCSLPPRALQLQAPVTALGCRRRARVAARCL